MFTTLIRWSQQKRESFWSYEHPRHKEHPVYTVTYTLQRLLATRYNSEHTKEGQNTVRRLRHKSHRKRTRKIITVLNDIRTHNLSVRQAPHLCQEVKTLNLANRVVWQHTSPSELRSWELYYCLCYLCTTQWSRLKNRPIIKHRFFTGPSVQSPARYLQIQRCCRSSFICNHVQTQRTACRFAWTQRLRGRRHGELFNDVLWHLHQKQEAKHKRNMEATKKTHRKWK